MAKFVSAHITTCMTRQDIDRLIRRFLNEGTDKVRLVRMQSDTIEGRMVCEWEAEDKESVVTWLSQRNVRFRGNEEWIIKIQMETVDGKLVKL